MLMASVQQPDLARDDLCAFVAVRVLEQAMDHEFRIGGDSKRLRGGPSDLGARIAAKHANLFCRCGGLGAQVGEPLAVFVECAAALFAGRILDGNA